MLGEYLSIDSKVITNGVMPPINMDSNNEDLSNTLISFNMPGNKKMHTKTINYGQQEPPMQKALKQSFQCSWTIPPINFCNI
jgi:hypothetical protein